MNQAQFDIVKLFQKSGADYKKLAKSFNEPTLKIARAYNANSYEEFLKSSTGGEDLVSKFGEMFGI